jgi:hypothetical protein
MPRYVCHHEGRYFEWSTVVDSPVTPAMSREEFAEYYKGEYGRRDFEADFEARVERAEKNGTSAMTPTSLKEMTTYNRAGPNERRISLKKILKMVEDWRNEDESEEEK